MIDHRFGNDLRSHDVGESSCSGSGNTSNQEASSELFTAKVWRYGTSSLGMAIITTLAVFGLMLAIRPPFIMKTPSLKDREEPGVRWIFLAIWSVLAGIIVILIPPLAGFCKSVVDKDDKSRS